jgi:hypothetical protein
MVNAGHPRFRFLSVTSAIKRREMNQILVKKRQDLPLMGLDVDLRRSAALVTLSSHNLVVVISEPQSVGIPGVEVGLHVDTSAGALVPANREILLKCANSINRGLVDASLGVNVIGASVGVDGALIVASAAGVICAKVLDNVVLNQRVASPAVDGEVTVALGGKVTAVVDGAGSCVSGQNEAQGRIVALGRKGTYRPVPGFQPLPPTKLPVFLQVTAY